MSDHEKTRKATGKPRPHKPATVQVKTAAGPDPIRVFLSSRIRPTVRAAKGAPVPLGVIRDRIEARLYEGIGSGILWVFKSEAEPPLTDQSTIGKCLDEARRAHIFICLCTGDPGVTDADNPLGICHRELQAAINDSPDKVVLIVLSGAETEFKKHPAFQILVEDFQQTHKKWVASVRNDEEMVDEAVAGVLAAVRRMGWRALSVWRRNRSYSGSRVRWASMTMSERASEITRLLDRDLTGAPGAKEIRPPQLWSPGILLFPVTDKAVLLTITAVPDSFGVPDARKYCGYPFRDDRAHTSGVPKGWTGPVHVVGVHKGITESQMRAHIGNADIAILKTAFGYAAQDRSQAVQVLYLVDCVEEDATVEAAAALMEWFRETEMAAQMLALADRRRGMIA